MSYGHPHENGIDIDGGTVNLGTTNASEPLTINTGSVEQTGGTLAVYCGIQWNATVTHLQNGGWNFNRMVSFISGSSISLQNETLTMWIDPTMDFSSNIFMEPGAQFTIGSGNTITIGVWGGGAVQLGITWTLIGCSGLEKNISGDFTTINNPPNTTHPGYIGNTVDWQLTSP